VNKKNVILIVILVLLVAVFVYAFASRSENKVQYQTASVQRGDIRAQVEATGTINAVTSVQVGSQVSGNIAKLNVDFNSQVKKGQLIAELDPTLFQGQLLQAQADLENARANAAAAKANLEKAKATATQTRADYNRTLGLTKEGVLSQQALDLAKSNAESSDASVSAAAAQVRQADAQVQQKAAQVTVAKTNLNYTKIIAPIDGTVINRAVDVGQTVAASLQAPTLFTIAQDLTKMLVYAKTDESDVGRIRPGQPVTFKVDAFPNETFRGQVQEVRMNATVVQNVVTYDTIVAFNNPDMKLFPGMTAYVTIPVAKADNVLKVPNGALRFKPDLDPKQIQALCEKYSVTGGACGGSGRRNSDQSQQAASADQSQGGQAQQTSADQQAGASPNGNAQAQGRGNFRGQSGKAGQGGANAQAQGRQGGNAGGASSYAGNTSGSRSGGAQTAIIWKLLPDKSLQPVKITAGITDFTFTEVKDGGLNDGDQVVTGQTGGSRAGGAPRLGQGGPGGGRPGGR
jgi:HlyD family secretion protein